MTTRAVIIDWLSWRWIRVKTVELPDRVRRHWRHWQLRPRWVCRGASWQSSRPCPSWSTRVIFFNKKQIRGFVSQWHESTFILSFQVNRAAEDLFAVESFLAAATTVATTTATTMATATSAPPPPRRDRSKEDQKTSFFCLNFFDQCNSIKMVARASVSNDAHTKQITYELRNW